MKLFNMSAVAFIFLAGLLSPKAETTEEVTYDDTNCTEAFYMCDWAHPDDHDDFDNCMYQKNCASQ